MAREPRVEFFEDRNGDTVIEVISANGKIFGTTEGLAGVHGPAQVKRRAAATAKALNRALALGRVVRRET